jgi:LemA protein
MSTTLIVVIAIVVIIGLWAMTTYNRLVKLKNLKEEGWSGMDVQLKRRFDLIPNLVETVKGYAAHEKETLENVTMARSAVASAGSDPAARMQAENMLTGTLRSLFAVAENYPQLKANENFLQLQQQLASLEDDIQMARRYYNGTVRNFNTMIQGFPAVLIARQMGFSEAPFFEADEGSRQAPAVNFTGQTPRMTQPAAQQGGSASASGGPTDKKIGF